MNVSLAIAAGAWMIEAFALGFVMGRRGYDAYVWTLVGTLLGPVGVAFAVVFSVRGGSREPRLLRGGRDAGGPIDVLVGIDGSPAAAAAVDRAVELFGATIGRITLARVVPVDASRDVEQLAENQLAGASAAHPDVDAAAVMLRGEPVKALRDYANELGYEIVVLGTRGEGKRRGMLGSVAAGFARGAGIPVLLVDAATLD